MPDEAIWPRRNQFAALLRLWPNVEVADAVEMQGPSPSSNPAINSKVAAVGDNRAGRGNTSSMMSAN